MSVEFNELVLMVGGAIVVVIVVCGTAIYISRNRRDIEVLGVMNGALNKMSAVVDAGDAAALKAVRALRRQADELEWAITSAGNAVRSLRDETRRLLDRRPKMRMTELASELRPAVSATLSVMAALIGIYDGFGLGDQLRLATDALATAFDVADPLAAKVIADVELLPRLALPAG